MCIMALPLRPLQSRVSMLCFLFCLKVSHFSCSRILVIISVSYEKFPIANDAAQFCTFLSSCLKGELEDKDIEYLLYGFVEESPVERA